MEEKDFTSFKDILSKKVLKKPPAYQWQELALNVIKELRVPDYKRNSVFLVCKKFSREVITQHLNDTKELCKTGDKWKYFFKLIGK